MEYQTNSSPLPKNGEWEQRSPIRKENVERDLAAQVTCTGGNWNEEKASNFCVSKTEREGFEPSVRPYDPYNRLAICRFQPLSHLSTAAKIYDSRSLVATGLKAKAFSSNSRFIQLPTITGKMLGRNRTKSDEMRNRDCLGAQVDTFLDKNQAFRSLDYCL